MSKGILTINKLMLTFAGAIIGMSAIAQNNVSAQPKITNKKVVNSTTKQSGNTQMPNKKSSNTSTAKSTAKNTTKPPLSNRLPDSAKDLKAPSHLDFKTSSSITISAQPNSDLMESAQNNIRLTQASPTSISPFLKITPISVKPSYLPGLNAGTPSGFGLETGDGFIGVFGATAGRLRDNVDGSISLGTGLGDANQYFAVEGVFNINSIRRFAENGSFDLKVHKVIYGDTENQVGLAVGWTNFANYGSNAGGTPSSVYGVATLSRITNPEDKDNPKPLIFSAGVGGGTYRRSDSNGGLGVSAVLAI